MNQNTETPSQTKKKNAALPIVVAVAGAGLVAFVAGRSTAPNPPASVGTNAGATTEAAPESEAPSGGVQTIVFEGSPGQTAGVMLAPVTLAPAASGIPFNGEVEASPNRVVRVSSVVPGRITRLLVSLGDRVQRGQTLAIVESRAIGEAQSAYQQAVARFQNAQSNLNVVTRQARAGVFARAPLEAARKAQVAAAGEARTAGAALRQAQVAYENVLRVVRAGGFASPALEATERNQAEADADVRTRDTAVRQAQAALQNAESLARVGQFANPSLEAARNQAAGAEAAERAAEAALENAQAATASAQAQLKRRRELAASGAYQSRPLQEARRALVTAQSARAAAQSEVATTRANLARARSLKAEGLMSQRDLEAAQQAFDTATARLETGQSDEATAKEELERQQRLATSDVAGVAEVQQAQAALAEAQADVSTRTAEVARARSGGRLAKVALEREEAIFKEGIANRREVSAARNALETAQTALVKARQTQRVTTSALQREQRLFGQKVANRREVSQALALLQTARSQLTQARQTFAVTATVLQREERIYRQNLNNIAQLETARAQFVLAQSDLRAAQTALSLLKSAPGGRASVPIVAPIGGTVQERPAAQGEVITADTHLMTIADLSIVHVDAFIPEREIRRVRVGSPIAATLDALPGRTFAGRIELVQSQVDEKTRTVEAHAEIPNPGDIKPGMFARGRIQTGAGGLQVSVLAEAVQDLDGKKVVFLPGAKANTFVVREVEAATAEGGRIVIKSGLKPGERIVTKGAFMVKAQSMKAALSEE